MNVTTTRAIHRPLTRVAALLAAVVCLAGCHTVADIEHERDTAIERATRFETQVTELQRLVESLRERIAYLEGAKAADREGSELPDAQHADGEVIRSIPTLKHVDIDLGSGNRIRAGIRFKVIRPSSSGHLRYVGAILVTDQISPAEARCTIIETTDRETTIASGDLIFNPLFFRTGTPTVSIAGEFDKTGRKSLVSVREHLFTVGASVQEAFDPEHTDILLLGRGPAGERAAERARRLGILVVHLKDMGFYLGID
jgi:hypothetical protein